jgi:hypothetical protein
MVPSSSTRSLSPGPYGGASPARGHRVAGEHELAGDVDRQRPWSAEESAAGGQQADGDLGQAEAGVGGGDHEVAGHGDLHAAAEREAFHRGDQRGAAVAADKPVLPTACGDVVVVRGEVAAGAEEPAGAGDDPAP